MQNELFNTPCSFRNIEYNIFDINKIKTTKTMKTIPINSPFRYAGGKFYARKLIVEHIPKHEYYIEPFAGGASIFFYKPKVKSNWLNDVDEELVNCYKIIRDFPEELIRFLKGIPASKEKHSYFKNIFKPKNEIEKAGRWFYLNRTSYSGIMKPTNCFWGYGDKFSMRPENWPNHITRCSYKLHHVKITCQDFEKVISKAPKDSFLFIDPPYFNSDQDKFYTYNFGPKDHERLADILKENKNKFKFLITYDNAGEIRKSYSWCKMILEKEWNYTLNRTDDQTKRTNRKGNRYKGKELFILNYNSNSAVDLFRYAHEKDAKNSSALDKEYQGLIDSPSLEKCMTG